MSAEIAHIECHKKMVDRASNIRGVLSECIYRAYVNILPGVGNRPARCEILEQLNHRNHRKDEKYGMEICSYRGIACTERVISIGSTSIRLLID